MRIRNVGILVNDRKTEAFPRIRTCLEALRSRGLNTHLLRGTQFKSTGCGRLPLKAFLQASDLLLVFGGDGSLLGAARLAGARSIPLAGINTGNLGFLTGAGIDEAEQAADDIAAGRFGVEYRMMLDVTVRRGRRTGPRYTVLNDMVISRGDISRLMTMRVTSGSELINDYFADGLVFATPTGSTAYSLSAGGPVVEPGMDALIITPICPHSLSERPLIVAGTRTLTVEFGEDAWSATLTMDGQQSCSVGNGDTVRIGTSSHRLPLVHFAGSSYFNTLRGKLAWGRRKENDPAGEEPGA